MRARDVIIAAGFAVLGLGAGIVIGNKRGIPFVATDDTWSVGIYRGGSPFALKPAGKNPVLTAAQITDVPADFVADPFIWYRDGKYALFVEILNRNNNQGDLAVAVSDDGENFSYKGLIIDEKWHLSYPYVFEWENQMYMMPESHEDKALHLYKATEYPTKWQRLHTLIRGKDFIDSTIFRHGDRWWILATTSKNSDILRLYSSDQLTGEYREHPKSPVVTENPRLGRQGGNVLAHEGRLYRTAQDASVTYATHVRAVEITKLTPTEYEEHEMQIDPIVGPGGTGWNQLAMHQVAVIGHPQGGFIAAVDGLAPVRKYGLRY